MRWWRLALVLVGMTALAACGAEMTPPSSAETSTDDSASAGPVEEPAPDPAPVSWEEVTDGTWDYGDIALGEPVEARLSEYAITITGPPILTTTDDGATVTMSSPLLVRRVKEQGAHDEPGQPVEDTESIWWTPGNLSWQKHSERYGLDTDVVCEGYPEQIGDETTCTVAFTSPADEIQDSHWQINDARAAAWPGQTP